MNQLISLLIIKMVKKRFDSVPYCVSLSGMRLLFFPPWNGPAAKPGNVNWAEDQTFCRVLRWTCSEQLMR